MARWIYNFHGGSLFRLPIGGGEEFVAVKGLHSGDWGYYAVTDRGVYYLDRAARQIRLLNPDTGASGKVVDLERLPGVSHRIHAMAVSPDHRWLIYSLVDGLHGDLKLVENFR